MEQNEFNSLKTAELTGLENSLFKKNLSNFLNNLDSRHSNLEKQSIIVMQGGSGIPRYDTDVQTFTFIQDSHFYYLTGVREADFYSIIDVAKKKLYLFYKLPAESTKIWQRVPSLEELSKKFDVDVLNYNEIYN